MKRHRYQRRYFHTEILTLAWGYFMYRWRRYEEFSWTKGTGEHRDHPRNYQFHPLPSRSWQTTIRKPNDHSSVGPWTIWSGGQGDGECSIFSPSNHRFEREHGGILTLLFHHISHFSNQDLFAYLMGHTTHALLDFVQTNDLKLCRKKFTKSKKIPSGLVPVTSIESPVLVEGM